MLKVCAPLPNPSPSQIQEPPPRPPKPKITLDLCFQGCPLYSAGAISTLAFLALDLATDWLLWKSLVLLWEREGLADHHSDLVHAGHEGHDQGHYVEDDNGTRSDLAGESLGGRTLESVPHIFLYVLIVASVSFALQLAHFCQRFWWLSRRYRSKLDGLPGAGDTAVGWLCLEDVMITLQVLAEDLPLSALLLYFQVNISCDFYVPFYGDMVAVLSLAASFLCTTWRSVQTVWHWGCLGARDEGGEGGEYYGGERLALLRTFNLTALLATLVMVTLNLIMIQPAHLYDSVDEDYTNRVLAKTALDRWVDSEYIVVTMETSQFAYNETTCPDPSGRCTPGVITYTHQWTSQARYERLVRLRDIVRQRGATSIAKFTVNNAEHSLWFQALRALGNASRHHSNSTNNATDSDLSGGGDSVRDSDPAASETAIVCTVFLAFQRSYYDLHIIDYNVGFLCNGSRTSMANRHARGVHVTSDVDNNENDDANCRPRLVYPFVLRHFSNSSSQFSHYDSFWQRDDFIANTSSSTLLAFSVDQEASSSSSEQGRSWADRIELVRPVLRVTEKSQRGVCGGVSFRRNTSLSLAYHVC